MMSECKWCVYGPSVSVARRLVLQDVYEYNQFLSGTTELSL